MRDRCDLGNDESEGWGLEDLGNKENEGWGWKI